MKIITDHQSNSATVRWRFFQRFSQFQAKFFDQTSTQSSAISWPYLALRNTLETEQLSSLWRDGPSVRSLMGSQSAFGPNKSLNLEMSWDDCTVNGSLTTL